MQGLGGAQRALLGTIADGLAAIDDSKAQLQSQAQLPPLGSDPVSFVNSNFCRDLRCFWYNFFVNYGFKWITVIKRNNRRSGTIFQQEGSQGHKIKFYHVTCLIFTSPLEMVLIVRQVVIAITLTSVRCKCRMEFLTSDRKFVLRGAGAAVPSDPAFPSAW